MISSMQNHFFLQNLQPGDYFIIKKNETNLDVFFARFFEPKRYTIDGFLGLPLLEKDNLVKFVESFSGIDFIEINKEETPIFFIMGDFDFEWFFIANHLREPKEKIKSFG